jgi:hypothetical protein
MTRGVFSAADEQQLHARGLTLDSALAQVAMFERGIPYTVLHRPCTVGDGLTVLPPDELKRLAAIHTHAAEHGRAMKFVPASGAASRMFKSLLAHLATEVHASAAEHQDFLTWVQHLPHFAFYEALKAVMAKHGRNLEALVAQERYQDVLAYLLTPKGLNYAELPKALLHFHRYTDHCRTPLEEHLVEAAAYTRDRDGVARLHCTVTPSHMRAMHNHLEAIRPRYEHSGVRFEVTFSTQAAATDTIAVDLENRPFRDQAGRLLFRPAGHGALLANLHALGGDIVFVKNIDNVVPDHLKADTYLYKRALAGYLIEIQHHIFTYLYKLSADGVDHGLVSDVFRFVRDTLSVSPPPGTEQLPHDAQKRYVISILNRPLRVCGMVKNAGEPGGGPFWVQQPDGSLSLQIVETSQVNMQDSGQRDIVAAATHFNPVDLVCGLRDFQGNPFDLPRFSDPNTGFISTKSHDGKPLKALELPGLWNGAMAYWNTVFVEVPLSTFNPVKTVLDLLRPQHQTSIAPEAQ